MVDHRLPWSEKRKALQMSPSPLIPKKQLVLLLEREEQVLLPASSHEELVQAVADLLLEALSMPMQNVAQTPEVGDEF
jgi:hypothetical protein